jgi:two-component system, cell cycle response regulator
MDVLIAHGSEESRRRLAASLELPGLRLNEAADGPEALEALLAGEPPRVALVDWDLPRIEGPELCRLVRDFHVVDPPYVILLAGSAHHHEVEDGLTAGAHDCVRTPAAGAELRARVEMARRVVELPWGRDEMCGGRCADLDGVLSREAVVQRLDAELARARRERADLSIGIVDVDGLAAVNGSLGRAAGDAVLRELMTRIRPLLRPYDALGRLGGEEFLVIVSRTTEDDVGDVFGRLREGVASSPFEHEGRPLAVTVSVGAATGREEDAGELIVKAMQALGEAQEGGGDSLVGGRKALLEPVLFLD